MSASWPREWCRVGVDETPNDDGDSRPFLLHYHATVRSPYSLPDPKHQREFCIERSPEPSPPRPAPPQKFPFYTLITTQYSPPPEIPV